MRKALTAIIALALVLGMTQCKKKDVIAPISNDGLFITFSANSNQGNTKTEFDPNSYPKFVWSSGVEYVNVGGSVSGYLGQISGDGTNQYDTEIHREFSGSITAPQYGETLYFFYLGKGDHAGATSIDFADQTGNLSDVTNKHIAIGRTAYTGQTDFTATLNMAMSIACFNTEYFVDGSSNPETVYLYGEDIFSSANIDYTNGTISGNAKSYICTGKANKERYVALIPGTANNPVSINFVSESHGGSIYFNGGINAQVYYAHTSGEPGLEVAIDPSAPGFVPYSFSVSSTKKVRFSKGNLMYSNGTWSFHENQYDMCITNSVDDVADQFTASGTFDLFGWATNGYQQSSREGYRYQPYHYDGTNYDYGPDFVGNVGVITNADSDWGRCNIVNGGGAGVWRSLTGFSNDSEWNYLFQTRTTSNTINGKENARWTAASINDTYLGVILFPDNYGSDTPSGVTWGRIDNSVGSGLTECTLPGWASLEAKGCVFLPAAGRRDYDEPSGQVNVMLDFWGMVYYGYYWGSNRVSENKAGSLYFTISSNSNVNSANDDDTNHGYSVRLVRDVE